MTLTSDDVQRCAAIIRQDGGKKHLTPEKKLTVQKAQLKLAMWVCQQEGLRPTRRNIAAILGPDAKAVLSNLTKLLGDDESLPVEDASG